MNNLVKILISLCLSVGLYADQGMLSDINTTSANYATMPVSVEVSDLTTDGVNIYGVSGGSIYKYDANLTSDTNATVGSTNKKILLHATKVFVLEDYNLYIRDINLTAVATYTSTKFLKSFAISSDGSYAFLATTNGIDVIDIASTSKVASVATADALDVAIKNDTLYLADNWGGIKVFDIQNPALTSLGSTLNGIFYKVTIENNYLYALGENGLSIYDITSPSAPVFLSESNVNPDAYKSVSPTSTLSVGDMYGYIGFEDTLNANSYNIYTYDLSNKKNITMLPSTYGINLHKKVAILDLKVYLTTAGGISAYNLETDYPDTLVLGDSSPTKTITNLDPNNGVFGELGSANDVDVLKLELINGRFIAIIEGMNDLNVSLYDGTNATSALFNGQTDNSKTLTIDIEVSAGTYYLMVQSIAGETGEYKITAANSEDDWSGIASFSQPISLGQTIKGNIIDSGDIDYFRVDFTSKGVLDFTSLTPELITISVEESNGSVLTSSGSLVNLLSFELPSAGTYFIKVQGIGTDIVNADYSFRGDFSQNAALDKEDNAPFALKDMGVSSTAGSEYDNLVLDGNSVFYSYFFNSNKLTELNSTLGELNTYNASGIIGEYKIVGDYIYILEGTSFKILQKSNFSLLGTLSLSSSTLEHLVISGNYAYISENISNRIHVIDITDRANPTTIIITYPSGTVYDFALKNSFIDDTLKTYLYLATSNGMKVYDYTDPLSIQELQLFQGNDSFKTLVLSGDYAYLATDYSFSIVYVKNPTSLPRLRGSIDIQGITKITLNQNYAYLVTSTNAALPNETYLKVLDIEDKTTPTLLDTTTLTGDNKYVRTTSIAVQNGTGYIIGRDINGTQDQIFKYDMAKDYADTKNYATPLSFATQTYGTISSNRVSDTDMFYITLQSTSTLTCVFTADTNISYEINRFNDDSVVATFDTLASQQSTNTFTLAAGEYYMRVHSTSFLTSGAYNFSVTKQNDDYTDSYSDAEFIDFNKEYSADISVALDVDMVKIIIDERGLFEYTTSAGITTSLYYEDAVSLITTDTNTKISVTLNPGTYYIKMESQSGFTGNYTFSSNFTSDGSVTVVNGFDNIDNFNSKVIAYGPRYVYSIDTDNQLSVYNHLLQRVEKGGVNMYNQKDLQRTCGQTLYIDNKLFINFSQFDGATGKYICSNGYASIKLENTEDGFVMNDYSQFLNYTSNSFNTSADDIVFVGIDDSYLYEFSKINFQIYKVKLSEVLGDVNGNNQRTPVGVFATSTIDVDNVKNIKNDGNIDFIAIDDTLTITLSDPALDQYDNATSPPTYVGTFPTVTDTKSYTLEGDIEDMYIDKSAKILYVINKNSTNVKRIYYSSGVSASTMDYLDLGLEANGMFVKDNEVYISFPSYGVRVYNYPLVSPVQKTDIANIGAEISRPFSYDGTTVVYLSSGNLQLNLIGDTFKDGTTAGSYSIVNDVQEGQGGFEGCFIATAAYGNYFEKHVKVLRDFRDSYLMHNELGRLFVDTYYRYSPSIAKDIAHSNLAKAGVRVVLTPIVYAIKYPFAILGLMLLLMMLSSFRQYFKMKKIILPFLFASMMLSGCSQSNDAYAQNNDVPSIRDFVGHIDINSTTNTIGLIDIISEGGSNIEGYELEGVGSSNFSITKDGEISILNHLIAIKYDLSVVARNKYGLSDAKKVIIEVTSLTQPILNDLVVNTDILKTSGSFNEQISIERDGLGTTLWSNIGNVEIVGEDKNSISVDAATGFVNIYSALSAGQHYFMLRPINSSGIIGPYTSLIINVAQVDYVDNTNYDDYPDDINSANYIGNLSSIAGVGAYGSMNFDLDIDYMAIDVDENGTYNIVLDAQANPYSYQPSFTNYDTIQVFDGSFGYIGEGYSSYSISLSVGRYYIGVSGASDNYFINIYFQ